MSGATFVVPSLMRWAVLLALSACASGPERRDVPPPVEIRPTPARDPVSTAPCEPCAEPFSISEVAFEVDPFEKRPAVMLPADARLDIGQRFGSVGEGPDAKTLAPHFASIAYGSDREEFERRVAGPMRGAIRLRPDTWLAFASKPGRLPSSMGYESVILRLPPLATAKDVAIAKAVESAHLEIDLNAPPGEEATLAKPWAVNITLDDAAVARIEAWTTKHPPYPLAYVAHGRVVEAGRMYGRSKDFSLELGGSRAAAEKLANEIAGARAH